MVKTMVKVDPWDQKGKIKAYRATPCTGEGKSVAMRCRHASVVLSGCCVEWGMKRDDVLNGE
jgi:hypothetical protein